MKTLSNSAGHGPQLRAVASRCFGCCLVAAAVLALSLTGCSTTSNSTGGPAQTAGAQIDDHNTTSAVGYALASDPQYKFGSVNVETSAGTVQLSGFVLSDDQRSRAGNIAKNVPTVKAVLNNLAVKAMDN